MSRVSSSQAPTQRENTQREGWAFQQWPEGKSEVGPCLPRGHREEQPGASRPLGKASTHQDDWLAGTAGKPPGMDEGPEWRGCQGGPLEGGGRKFPVTGEASANPYSLGRTVTVQRVRLSRGLLPCESEDKPFLDEE